MALVSDVKQVAVLCDYDSGIGFRGVGAYVFPCSNTDDALRALEHIYSDKHRDRYAVVFITEELSEALGDHILNLKERFFSPIITIIPSRRGSSGLQERMVRKTIETAVGFDIFGNK